MFTTRPQRCRTIDATTACVAKNAPLRLVWITVSQSARFIRMSSVSLVTPALFTRISILPKRSSAAFTALFTSPSLLTSMRNTAACTPRAAISLATLASFSSLRAASATSAPPSARASAHARPIPCDAPVTSATRPVTPAIWFKLLHPKDTRRIIPSPDHLIFPDSSRIKRAPMLSVFGDVERSSFPPLPWYPTPSQVIPGWRRLQHDHQVGSPAALAAVLRPLAVRSSSHPSLGIPHHPRSSQIGVHFSLVSLHPFPRVSPKQRLVIPTAVKRAHSHQCASTGVPTPRRSCAEWGGSRTEGPCVWIL